NKRISSHARTYVAAKLWRVSTFVTVWAGWEGSASFVGFHPFLCIYLRAAGYGRFIIDKKGKIVYILNHISDMCAV
ncbi:MAG: hypothetical protein Q4D55_04630, partial [Eubacteriales bacterium]|nr:hypothetical protein [Eubacteriales bacterium]